MCRQRVRQIEAEIIYRTIDMVIAVKLVMQSLFINYS